MNVTRVVSAVVALLLIGLPAFAQEKSAGGDPLKAYKGRDLLDELRLREAAAVKSKPETKEWLKGVKPESLSKNMYLAETTAEDLVAKVKASPLKAASSAALFDELKRRAETQKGVFGADDRVDLFRLETRRAELVAASANTDFLDGALKNAAAVCCMVQAGRLSETTSGTMRMSTSPYSESRHDTIKLCAEERFFSQPVGAFCTAFLVAPDVVVTAGHCIDTDDVPTTRFVFGYRMASATQAVTTFPKEDVYKAKEIVGRVLDNGTGEDWAVVRLDRKVANATPLKVRTQGKIENGKDIYVVGFPSGLPCKVSDNAKVNVNTNKFVFMGNLDTFGGNSGSPVFNRETHEVEGILVRGGKDFTFATDVTGGCFRSVVLADNEGREECTRATVWAAKIPAN